MASAKEIKLKVIPSKIANAFVRRWHYSGKVVKNSQLHFGAFLNNELHGVMSFGPSLDKRKIQGLVKNTGWNEFLELNRMAFDNILPRNSESRCISIAMKLLKKNAPHIKWIVSFADGTQCGDGAIYRASGFILTAIKTNNRLLQMPDGEITHGLNLAISGKIRDKYNKQRKSENRVVSELGLKYLDGFQLKYIYFLHPKEKENLTVPILPFSKIDEMNAGMYKGEKITYKERNKRPASIDSDASGGCADGD